MSIPAKDRTILRKLGQRIADIAAQPIQQHRIDLWKRLNRLERVRTMIGVVPGANLWEELVGEKDLVASDRWARQQELALRRRLYQVEVIRDDTVLDDVISCPVVIRDTGWGIAPRPVRPAHAFGAKHYQTVIEKESDIDKIQMPQVTVDWETTERNYERLREVYDGVLRVQKQGVNRLVFAIMDHFIQLRGVERTFLDLMERPDWVHEAMDRMTRGSLSRLDQLEAQGALGLNNGNCRSGSGGYAFTDELPQRDFDGRHVRTIDMWGHATTQIFSEIGPAMHDEFALQYERRFMARCGLCNYGCCEPLHNKIDIIKTVPNIRRVSMSPWVDVAVGAAGLGKDYIFSYKPNPAILAADTWDPQHARAVLRDMLDKTPECPREIVMKDLHSLRGEPRRLVEWTALAMRLADECAA